MTHAPSRAGSWQLRTRTLAFGELPAIMGIINVTPDSFSDGGSYLTPESAIEHALRLEDGGADLLDVGGESTRPYSTAVAAEEELRRIEPVLAGLSGRVACPISIDTSKSQVARAALELGAEIINDVTGLEGDPDMLQVAVESRAAVCAMHMQGTPQTMQDAPHYTHVVQEILQYLLDRKTALIAAGVEPSRICLDPGIGFGKTHQHNIELVRYAARFLTTDCPILVGHSRKRFISKLMEREYRFQPDSQTALLAGTLGVSLGLAQQGIQILRVHDVAATRDALCCFAAAGGVSAS